MSFLYFSFDPRIFFKNILLSWIIEEYFSKQSLAVNCPNLISFQGKSFLDRVMVQSTSDW